MLCKKCQGDLEPISRMNLEMFLYCRACKLPHDKTGRPMISSPRLNSEFNVLQKARDTIKTTQPEMGSVGRTALEVALVQAFNECYFNGLRDGVLLAYSQDYEEGRSRNGPLQSPANHSGKSEGPG